MTKKLLLKHIDVPGIQSLEVYRQQGGYENLKKALGMAPDAITEEVK